MNGRDKIRRTKYRAIEDYDGEAGTQREAGAATYFARLYSRLDLLERLCRDWSQR
jgi:hypothetical protein